MSSNSPCAACKFLRRKCTEECAFAPYFPPDQPKKFEVVHKVFGASNVAKILNELHANHREDAVNSLAYEAEARLQDPVYGCVGHISILQTQLKQTQNELINAKKVLAACTAQQAMNMAIFPTTSGFMPPNMTNMVGGGGGSMPALAQQIPIMGVPTGIAHPNHGGSQQPLHHQQQQQMYEAQQLAVVAAAREQEVQMMRNYVQQRGQEMLRYNNNGGFDQTETNNAAGADMVTATGFNQITETTDVLPMSLGLGIFENNAYHHHQQPPQEATPNLPHQQHNTVHPLRAQFLLNHHQQQGQILPPYEAVVLTHQQQPQLEKADRDEAGTIGGGSNL